MNNIRKIRTEKSISQAVLAEKTGIARNTLSGYETGVIQPPPKRIMAIAEALGCTVSDLFGENEVVELNKLVTQLLDTHTKIQYQGELLTYEQRAYFYNAACMALQFIKLQRKITDKNTDKFQIEFSSVQSENLEK